MAPAQSQGPNAIFMLFISRLYLDLNRIWLGRFACFNRPPNQ